VSKIDNSQKKNGDCDTLHMVHRMHRFLPSFFKKEYGKNLNMLLNILNICRAATEKARFLQGRNITA